MKSNWSYSPETLNSGQNRQFFVPRNLEIWRMILKNNRAPLPCCFKLCVAFHSHWWIQTGVAVRKPPICLKTCHFLAVCPWNLTDDLDKQSDTSSKQHQALCIILWLYVNSNRNYGPKTAKWGNDLCDLDLLHGLSMVISPENFRMMRRQEPCQKAWQTDGGTDRRKEVFLELLGHS